MNPMHQWWIQGQEGPLNVDEYMCEFCCDYLIAVYVEELWTGEFCFLCNRCGGMALYGHNYFWSIADMYWL